MLNPKLELLMPRSKPVNPSKLQNCSLDSEFVLVYPNKTKEMLASSTVEELMNEKDVKAVLGTIVKIEKSLPELFHKSLQHYVDSKEKSTSDSKKKRKEKGEKKVMEYWPLIKVVRIYTKADALSTGAVIVDLPVRINLILNYYF